MKAICLFVFFLLVIYVCAGCAALPPVPGIPAAPGAATPATSAVTAAQSLAQLTTVDLDAAIATAAANSDTDGVACFTVLKKYVGATPTGPQIAGVFSGFEAVRVKVNTLNAGVPKDLHTACAPVVLDAETTLVKLGVIAASKVVAPGLPTPLAPGLPLPIAP